MNELVAVEQIHAIDVFVDRGLDPFLEQIEKEVRTAAVSLDISTEAGRKEIASLAYKVARSKTALDDLGKNLTEDWKAKSRAVDAERKRMRDKLDALKDEIRSPLTEWENKEKARLEKHEADIAEITNGGTFTLQSWQNLSVEVMRDRLKEIEADGAKDWQEFQARGKYAVDTAVAAIKTAIEKREHYDAEQAELARLRKAEEERKQKEREERIAAESAARATAEAEAEAKRKEEAAEETRLALVREKDEADRRAQAAEDAKKAAEEKAVRDRIAAEAKAKRDAEAAAQAEREQIEAERQAEADAAAKREADKKHRTKINNEALAALVASGLAEADARKAVEVIAKGQVPHVKIAY
jgi:colicin import membrane protein